MTDTDERIQRALDHLREDETLTTNLDDGSAKAVFAWLEPELRQAPVGDEQGFEERIAGLRRAIKQAARRYDGDSRALLAEIQQIASGSLFARPHVAGVAATPDQGLPLADRRSDRRRRAYLRRKDALASRRQGRRS